jgi:hypothetical protein
MTDLTERMIAAAGRAMWERATASWRDQARAALTAALAEAEADGAALVQVPEKDTTYVGGSIWGDGWNACRAAVLKGKVTL